MSSVQREYSATQPQPFANHGRNPTIEMRHTIDDKLLVATHASFCSFRALMHRNGDTIVLLSDVGREVRLRGASVSRGVVVADQHVYVMSLPSTALFAPASSGGCFSIKEFSRICTVVSSPHVILQFVNGVVTLLFHNQQDVDRVVGVIYSATGVAAEAISAESFDLAYNAQHYARDSGKYSVSIAPSNTSKISKATKPESSVGTASGTGRASFHSGGSDSDAPIVVEQMLRRILGGRSGDDFDKNFPDVGLQTDQWIGKDAAVTVAPMMVDRGSSPVGFAEEKADSHSDGSGSDFDPSDVFFRTMHARKTSVAPAVSKITAQRFDPQGHPPIAALAPSIAKKLSFVSAPPTTLVDDDRSDDAVRTPLQRQGTVVGGPQQSAVPSASSNTVGTSLDAFLGVMSTFLPQMQAHGVDSVSKLLRMSPTELDELMDNVGMNKQGHRIMLQNKLSLAKHAKHAKK